ncbi:hypothetical protein JDV02_000451 [Purpureocillium takamizusanense]|uniref:Adiponectin receptor protein 1 n=1 Tax=Purpureocillium takamizusanense TaxID=2060973 RepID=A0A9Q8Q673_9HYPO|nr:uncharacterized protein JDV02_000451 [Purpureocillium takamizusanense]UNI13735.1 hypothetical protein JDV02_000451 [Purpureocillium takamizusanense]
MHNETANIWSHLLGALYILVKLFNFMHGRALTVHATDAIAVALFFLSCVACFLMSASYHCLSDHSPGINRLGNQLDHLGIVVIFWGASTSACHFVFASRDTLKATYILVLSVSAAVCGWFTLQPMFRTPRFRSARALTYSLLGLSMAIPFVHVLLEMELEELDEKMELSSFLGMILLVFLGGLMYAVRVPERWFPGTFDVLGQSHNWLHVLVLAAALLRLDGLLDLLANKNYAL